MQFDWDSVKAAANLNKHGVDFPDAAVVFTDEFRIESFDSRQPYGEDRFVAIGLFDGNELIVVYTLRGGNIRIISARKANAYERRNYWDNR